jgi:putative transposase
MHRFEPRHNRCSISWRPPADPRHRAGGDHVLAVCSDEAERRASAHAIYGLTKLSVWWLRLGIQIERSKPRHPQDNGRHERMHLTLKREATKPASPNVLQQQARFDDFVTRFNTDRLHQALGMKVPADLYARSPRVYRGLEELTYPFHDQTIMVTAAGASASVAAR